MELRELTGEHMLDAVDFSNEQVKAWGQFVDSRVVRFRLDGTVYVAVEDPNDGYRSHMKDLVVSGDITMENVFEPVKVVGRHRDKGRYNSSADVLALVDASTSNVVLEVGTEDSDYYYPYFIASFHPEAIFWRSIIPPQG